MDDNRSLSVMVWGAIHYGNSSELVVLNENSTKATTGFSVIVWFLGNVKISISSHNEYIMYYVSTITDKYDNTQVN